VVDVTIREDRYDGLSATLGALLVHCGQLVFGNAGLRQHAEGISLIEGS
jgi:hypothetical protein